MELLGPLVSAGSAGEEAGVDRKKNWSAGGLLERERPLKVCGRSLQPMREATERLAALLTFWIKESNAGPMNLETSEVGREVPEDCAFREALLRRDGRGAGIDGGSMDEESGGGRGAEVASWRDRDERPENCKGGKVPRVAEPPGTQSRPCFPRWDGIVGW